MPNGSSAGAGSGRYTRAACWIRWRGPCTNGAHCIAAALCITATKGSHHVSNHHTECLAQAAVEPSAGSIWDNYDNVLAETLSLIHI